MLVSHQIQPSSSNPQNRTRKIIAHRGLCSIFPENTKQAIIAGIHSSDLVEFDVHLTKDNEVIVFHDRYLSRLTDVRDHGSFRDRFKEETIDDYHQKKGDWWVRDFTLAELRELRVFQPVTYRPQYDSLRFGISTLEEIIQQTIKITTHEPHRKTLKSGLLIEIKQQIANSLTNRDKIACQKIVQLLKKYNLATSQGCQQNNLAIVIQSFNIPLLACLEGCENKLVQLYDKDVHITEEFLLKNWRKNVGGIGITQNNLLDGQGVPEKRVSQICEKLNYSLYYWTVRDDDLNKIPFGLKNYHDVYLKLEELGVTGFITEFPDKCKGIFKIESPMYSKGNIETSKGSLKDLAKEGSISQCDSMDSFSPEKTEQGTCTNNP